MTRAEMSKQFLFQQFDGLKETGKLTTQEMEALKIYAVWAIQDAVACAPYRPEQRTEQRPYQGPDKRLNRDVYGLHSLVERVQGPIKAKTASASEELGVAE